MIQRMSKKICIFGYHDQNAPRQWNINKTLQNEGWELTECHTAKKGFFAKIADLRRQLKRREYKALFIPFPGHYLVPIVKVITHRKKIYFDAFLSLYDTMVCDRKLVSRWNPYAWLLWFVDYLSCHLADEVWIDTKAHKEYFIKMFRLNPKKIRVHYLGTRDDLFFPKQRDPNPQYEVLFYGSYIPLQGIETIIDAADQLPDVHFTLIGKGQTYHEMKRKAEALTNITFHDPVPLTELPNCIRSADLCLGIFGTSNKAQRVIPHKVYDAVACGIPVITANTPAIHEYFDGNSLVHLCPAGDRSALAKAIKALAKDHPSLQTKP